LSTSPPFVEGEIVDAEVTSAHPFGLYCQARGTKVLVRITDLSHLISVNSAAQFAAPGDRLAVQIIDVSDDGQAPIGSVKGAFPDGDPARGDWLRVGSEFDAEVVRPVEDSSRCDGRPGYLVRLRPGAYALLCGREIDLRPGDTCRVHVAELSEDKRLVRLAPVGRAA
jgi:hypothetical protein